MEEEKTDGTELRSLIRGVIDEFVHAEQAKAEPAYKAELLDERKRREDLEKRVNDLVQENARSRKMAEEAERSSSIRAELQQLGVVKVDLAYRAVRDDVQRREDGQLIARSGPDEDGASRLSKAVCARESRVIAGADYRRIGDGIRAESRLPNTGVTRSGQNSTGHESGRAGEDAPRGLESGESGATGHVKGTPGIRLKGPLTGVGSRTIKTR